MLIREEGSPYTGHMQTYVVAVVSLTQDHEDPGTITGGSGI